MGREQLCAIIDRHQKRLIELSRTIWGEAETALEEVRSAKALAAYLEENEFSVQYGLAGMDTAFLARWGSGAPHILYLAEYDALPGLGQEAVSHEAPIRGKNGHACGHNLLGVGAAGAAVALKEYIKRKGSTGTVSLMGCPAEEIMEGKIRIAKAGLLTEYDVALTWHPEAINQISEYRYQAMYSVGFSFYGVPSHAAISPEAGRSALDAVELANVGANYLREHIPDGARLHYVIQNGGEKPNIVPAYARSWYYIRAPRDDLAKDIYMRVCDIARGAALMTGTRVEVEEISHCPATRMVPILNQVLDQAFTQIGPTPWSKEDMAFARQIQETLSTGQITAQLEQHPRLAKEKNQPLDTGISPLTGRVHPFPASSDVSMVSNVIPTGQIMTACYPIGTAGHSWPITACAGSQIGWKGMLTAAKTLALAGCMLCEEPELLMKIKEEFLAER